MVAGVVDFSAVFEMASSPQLLLDSDWRVIAASNGYLRSTGLSREEVLGLDVHDLPPYRANPGQRARLTEALRAVRSSFTLVTSELRDAQPGAAFVHFTSASSEPVPTDAQGGLMILHRFETRRAAVAGSAPERELTEYVKLADELRRNNELLRVALEEAHAIGWSWDRQTNEITWFGDFAAFSGQDPSLGMDELAMIHPEDQEVYQRAARNAWEKGCVFHVDFRGYPRESKERWFTARGQVQRSADGKIVRMTGVTWDITDLRAAQAEQAALTKRLQETQKLESLGVLAGGIAHDFNNLLTAILGNASLARLALKEEGVLSSYLANIEEASQRAAELCRQMLAYAGKGPVAPELTDLNQIVERMLDLLHVSVSKKALLRTQLEPELPAVMADATQIRQVIMNLVINASEAIGDRSGVIHVRTHRIHAAQDYLDAAFLAPEVPAGDYVCLEVSDTGEGMTADTKERIFEPFFSTKFTGRGLGLAAVLGIVRSHGGTLKVDSWPGKGSTFKLLLPAAAQASRSGGRTAPARKPFDARGTVLVVDDEAQVRTLARSMLERMGFDVLLAKDGREAIARYGEQRANIACVLLDFTMPRLDGVQTLGELRRIDPTVRVVLMSGYDEQQAVHRVAGEGVAGFLPKPFNFEDLEERLRALLACSNCSETWPR